MLFGTEISLDRALAFIGVLAAIVIPIIIYSKQRTQKALTYGILTKLPLITIGDEVKNRVKIVLDEIPVENVNLIIITFINIGNIPITATDFVEPIIIDFGNNAHIISSDILLVEPLTIRIDIKQNNNQIIIPPTLLNPEDTFTLKILASNPSNITVSGRIVGVKDIILFSKYQKAPVLLMPFAFVLISVGFFWVITQPDTSMFSPKGLAQLGVVFSGWLIIVYLRRVNLYQRVRRLLKRNNYRIRENFPGSFEN